MMEGMSGFRFVVINVDDSEVYIVAVSRGEDIKYHRIRRYQWGRGNVVNDERLVHRLPIYISAYFRANVCGVRRRYCEPFVVVRETHGRVAVGVSI